MRSFFIILVAFAVSAINGAFSQGTRVKKTGLVEKSIKLSTNVTLKYVEQGDENGIPVIFLHGITDSWHSFEFVLRYLPASIHAFAVSQRGHGDSERPSNGYHPKDFAADIAAFITQKKLGSAFIAGHSMGSVNTLQFVLNYPQLAKGIIIIDSSPSFKDNPGMPEFYGEVLKMEGALDKKFMEDFQKETLAKPIDADYFNLVVAEGLKVPASVFKASFTGFMEVDLTDRLKNIEAPVLIFWGEKDSFRNRSAQDLLKTNIKNSRLVVYEGTGHALHWEEPERFAKDLISFINNIHK